MYYYFESNLKSLGIINDIIKQRLKIVQELKNKNINV